MEPENLDHSSEGRAHGHGREAVVPPPDCPGDVDWQEVAFGLWPEMKTRQLIAHAARCVHCGPLLRAAVSLDDDASPAEEEFLAQLRRPARPEPRTGAAAITACFLAGWHRLLGWKAVATVAALVVVGMLAMVRLEGPTPVAGAELSQYAVSAHERRIQGRLPLALQSDSETRLQGWLRTESPFPVVLPAYRETLRDDRPYRLEGARLVQLRGRTAALIAYRMGTGPVSLLIVPESEAVASGGVEVDFKKVNFHYRTIDGYKVVTWSVHGLTYALVSQEGNETQASCMVCHSAMKDRDLSHTPAPFSTPQNLVEPVWQ